MIFRPDGQRSDLFAPSMGKFVAKAMDVRCDVGPRRGLDVGAPSSLFALERTSLS